MILLWNSVLKIVRNDHNESVSLADSDQASLDARWVQAMILMP